MDLSHLGLEEIYFENEENFNLNHIVNVLPDVLTSDYLLDNKRRLEKSLTVVTHKVSELILSRQPTYVDELQRIADLQKSLTNSIRVCTQGRSCLRFIKDGTTKNGFTIVENYKKRQFLAKLLESLTALCELKNFAFQIRNLIENQEDFPKAIQMCKDGEELLSSFREYKCVDGMNFKAINFFNAFHKSSMEELKMFLENEVWEMVPVKNDFKLVQLKEFSFLRLDTAISPNEEPLKQAAAAATIYKNSPQSYLDAEELLNMDRISLSTDSDDSELNKDFVQEDECVQEQSSPLKQQQQYHHQKIYGPVLTNSSLNVLRLIGKYTQMMTILDSISYEILTRIYELLDYYIKFVFEKFGPNSDRKSDKTLRTVIRSLRESLVGGKIQVNNSTTTTNQDSSSVATSLGDTNINHISSIVLTSVGCNQSPDEAINPQKTVAIESLIFLVNQIWNLQEYLESLIPADCRPQLREQFSQPNSMIPDFLKARAEIGPTDSAKNL